MKRKIICCIVAIILTATGVSSCNAPASISVPNESGIEQVSRVQTSDQPNENTPTQGPDKIESHETLNNDDQVVYFDTLDYSENVSVYEAYNQIENFSSNSYIDLETADTLYYIKADSLSSEEKQTLMSLQGIVAQTKSEIFLYYRMYEPWFQALQEYYGIKMIEVKSVWEMVDMFKEHLADSGYVRYHYYDSAETEYNLDYPEAYGSANVATMISGVYKYLMVDDSLISEAQAIGLVQNADAFDYFTQIDAFYDLKDSLNPKMMTSIESFLPSLRDITIALKMACWRDMELSELTDILTELGPNGIILGFHASEGNGVFAGSLEGWATVASDWGNNYSVYAGLKKSKLIQKPSLSHEDPKNKSVHYVTFMLSDGDNIQFISNSFIDNTKYFGSPLRGTIPFGWTLSPSLLEMGEVFPKLLYKNATINDEFVASVSGMGYMYPSVFNEAQLPRFLEITNKWMKGMDQRYVQIIDWVQNAITFEDSKKIREEYAKQPNIKGAFIYPVDNYYLYKNNAGSITWHNGKPFVSNRESLWIDEGTVTQEKVDTMISRMAYRINRYKKDPSVIEGYSVVNVHPWSFTYDDVVKMVSLLDKDVIVVTPTELMELIAKNVPKTDKLILDDVKEFDYTDAPVYKRPNDPLFDMPATEQLVFDFNGKAQGWVFKPGSKALDQVRFGDYADPDLGIRTGVTMAGSHFGTASDEPNVSMFQKIIIPEGITTLKLSYISDNARVRIREIKDDGSPVTIAQYAACDEGFACKEFDISALAGKTALIAIDFSDGNTNGNVLTIRKIELE